MSPYIAFIVCALQEMEEWNLKTEVNCLREVTAITHIQPVTLHNPCNLNLSVL